MDGRSLRLREARIAKGFETAAAAADAFGWNRNTYGSNENGNAPFSYRKAKEYAAAFGVRPEWLYDAAGAMLPAAEAGFVPIIGRVGANPEAHSSTENVSTLAMRTGLRPKRSAKRPNSSAPTTRKANVSVIAQLTTVTVEPNSLAMSPMTNSRLKKSKASSVQPGLSETLRRM